MMNEIDELTEEDRIFLNEIDRMILQSSNSIVVDDPRMDLCSLLTNTQPQASQVFQQKLWLDLAAREGISKHTRSTKNIIIPFLHQRRSTLLVLVAALVVVIITAAFIPPVRVFASEFIKHIILGKYSVVNLVESITPGATMTGSLPDNYWVIDTGIENIGGNLPEGVDSTVRVLDTIEEAQELISYPILQPKYLPDGYSLDEIKIPPAYPDSPECVYIFYSGTGSDLYISMLPVGVAPVITNNSIIVSLGEQQTTVSEKISAGITITDGSLEETSVHDQPAAWIDGNLLDWYMDGFLFGVGGRDLTEDEAIKIAESIE